jgi:hypothetical protein
MKHESATIRLRQPGVSATWFDGGRKRVCESCIFSTVRPMVMMLAPNAEFDLISVSATWNSALISKPLSLGSK